MSDIINKEWLDFPIHVFIDTQVFISESYDFSAKGKFASLKKLIKSGKVKMLTSSVIQGEVSRHIKEDVEKGLEKLHTSISDRRLAIFREGDYSNLFQPIDQSAMLSFALDKFSNYLQDVNAISLNLDDVDLNAVVSDYFSCKSPFGPTHKKSEFPDAFNCNLLKKYAHENDKVFVVSKDGDFSGVENIQLFKTLSELLDAIISQDNEICSQAKEYLLTAELKSEIFGKVENTLMDNGYELQVDGTDADRKGNWSGYEYDEIELLAVNVLDLRDLEIVDIDYSDRIIIIEAVCKSKLEFSCSFFDEDNSIWDGVDKEYAYTHSGTMHELHIARIPISISLYFDIENCELIDFDIDEIIVDINVEFNQYTLQKDGRSRTDNPYSYWEEEYENYCPDCGCGMNFDNDGGNGFCIICAPKH